VVSYTRTSEWARLQNKLFYFQIAKLQTYIAILNERDRELFPFDIRLPGNSLLDQYPLPRPTWSISPAILHNAICEWKKSTLIIFWTIAVSCGVHFMYGPGDFFVSDLTNSESCFRLGGIVLCSTENFVSRGKNVAKFWVHTFGWM
jgi:hypothetical protein